MKKLNQKGFGVVEGLLTVIALTLIVGVGFYVVNANKDKKDESKSSVQTSQKSLEHAKQEYIEFKELGIKIKKTNDLKDIIFTPKSSDKTYYYATTSELKTIVDNCHVSEGKSGPVDVTEEAFFAFGMGEGKYDDIEGPQGRGALVKQFDNFYISGSGPQAAACANEADQDRVNDIKDKYIPKLDAALKNAERL